MQARQTRPNSGGVAEGHPGLYKNFGVHVTCVVPDRVLWTFSTCKP